MEGKNGTWQAGNDDGPAGHLIHQKGEGKADGLGVWEQKKTRNNLESNITLWYGVWSVLEEGEWGKEQHSPDQNVPECPRGGEIVDDWWKCINIAQKIATPSRSVVYYYREHCWWWRPPPKDGGINHKKDRNNSINRIICTQNLGVLIVSFKRV